MEINEQKERLDTVLIKSLYKSDISVMKILMQIKLYGKEDYEEMMTNLLEQLV